MHILFNHKVFALRKRLMCDASSVPHDVFKTCGTPYGLFIPTTQSGFQFLRWVKKGMIDKLPSNGDISSFFLHVSNDGEICIAVVDVADDHISIISYYSDRFSIITDNRDTAEAINHFLKDSKNIQEAITVVEENDPTGMYDPHVFFASDWVKHAKENNYTENFYWCSFSGITNKKK